MTETDTLAVRFVQRWHDAARGFLSAMFHDPAAGLDAGALAGRHGLDPACFPDPELWTIADYLAVCAERNITPTVPLLVQAARIGHVAIHDGNDRNLDWLEFLETGAGNARHHAETLASFAARVTLSRAMIGCYWSLLGPLADYRSEP